MLASVGWAMEAGATELGQPSLPAITAQSQSFSLPSFLDVTRLPDLQAAWRQHFGAVEKPAFPAPMGVGARNIAVETEEGSVRTRAEELSRRFAVGADGEEEASPTAGDVPAATAAAPDASVSEGTAPTETASIHVNNSADVAGTEQALPPAENAAGANKRPAAAQRTSAFPPAGSAHSDNVPVIEHMAAKPVGRVSRGPAPARRIEQPTSSPTLLMAIGGLFAGSSEAPEPEGATMLPTELRSFGWRSQP